MATVRLDTDLEATLERLAKQRGQTKSDVIRDAIEHLARKPETGEASALETLRPFVGVADSGGRQLSRRTGERFRELLEERRRAGRPDGRRSLGRSPRP